MIFYKYNEEKVLNSFIGKTGLVDHPSPVFESSHADID